LFALAAGFFIILFSIAAAITAAATTAAFVFGCFHLI